MPAGPLSRLAGAGLVAALLLGGCSDGGPDASAPAGPATASSTASPTDTAAERCGEPTAPSRAVDVTTADGVRLPAYVAGSGPRGVVLVHQYASQLCGWWPYAARLASQGFHVLLFDDRCSGEAPCPQGAAGSDYVADVDAASRVLRADGAQRVVVVGASRGGAIAVAAAARPPAGVTAVVGLSAALLDAQVGGGRPALTALTAAPLVRIPVLLAVARGDSNVSVAQTRRLADLVPDRSARLVVLPRAAGHGWDTLRTADLQGWSHVATLLEGFLTAHL